jgi:microsomal dipeptidase-like Zn-dependent dipeptidase
MRELADWEKLHFDSALVDRHAHPSIYVSLFHRAPTSRIYPTGQAVDPFSARTNFPRLQQGSVDALLSILHAPDDLKDASQLPRLTQWLLAAGYSSDDIRKILVGNALRVLLERWKK